MSYKHLSITEREMLMFYRAQGMSGYQIAKLLGRNKSTISRELKRNATDYSPSKAQACYQRRRKKSCPHKKLAQPELFNLVKILFLDNRWSPEQIAQRLKLENYPIRVSYKTIYRAIYAGMFDTPEQKRSTGKTAPPWQSAPLMCPIAGKFQSRTNCRRVPSKQMNAVGLAISRRIPF